MHQTYHLTAKPPGGVSFVHLSGVKQLLINFKIN